MVDLAFDKELLDTKDYAIKLEPSIKFSSSLELGEYLDGRIGETDLGVNDSGVWSWLAIVFLDQLLTTNKAGQRLLGSSVRYVLEPDNRLRYYRHLIYMPYYVYRRLGDASYIFLHSPVNVSGEFIGQAQKDDVISNRNLVSMCEKYFFDKKNDKFVTGFTSAKKGDPRSMRRLVQAIIPQLNMNFDLRFCSSDEIFKLMPADFRQYAIAKHQLT